MAEREESNEAKKVEASKSETAKSEDSRPETSRPETKASSRGDRRSDGRDRSRGRGGGERRRYYRRKKVDYFSVNKIDDINYKDIDTLKQFIGDRGKILPRRHTGLSALHQRKLKIAIKRARNIALLPFAGETGALKSPGQENKS